jgi:hypothetical protein
MKETHMMQMPVRQAWVTSMRPYIGVMLAIVLGYILLDIHWGMGEKAVLRILMLAGVALCILYALLYRRSADRVMLAILTAGVIMRIGYMLYTPYSVRNHDVGSFDMAGHLGYMYNLFMDASLPKTNEYEFYHPPFQHIVQAAVVKVFSLFQTGTALEKVFEAAKLVPCFASSAVLLVGKKICEATGLSNRATALALVVIAFHPSFYLLSASVNNDSLMLLFFLISTLYTIRWYYRPTMKNILMVALAIGLAMMTKLSGSVAAFFTGPVFLAMMFKIAKRKEARQLLGQFAAFFAICLPLTLWYPLRNRLLFQQPFGYVLEISQSSGLYCGGRTLVERFLSFPLRQVFNPLYCQPYGDYNVWLYTLKCSVFGEFSFEQLPALAISLILANLLLIAISLAATIYVAVCGKEVNRFARFGLLGIWLVQMVSFLAFNVQYPFGCTMDFRYILPTAIIGAIYIGIALDRLKRNSTPLARSLYYGGAAAVGLFIVSSVLFYVV